MLFHFEWNLLKFMQKKKKIENNNRFRKKNDSIIPTLHRSYIL